MFDQILVPLDGSELAERALPCATHLAQAIGGRLHVVRVLDMIAHATWAPLPVFIPADVYAQEEREARAYLEAQ